MNWSAPAKLNLFLRITGCRSDGYHTLETLFLPLPFLCDEIAAEEKNNGSIRVSGSPEDQFPRDLDNLAGRAAAEYAKAAKLDIAWDIFIAKKIPYAAGLGGGSSDAGTLLRGLNAQYKRLDASTLNGIAAKLGADVPFFLNPRPAIGCGIGEKLAPLDFELPPMPLLLVNPIFPVSAKWGYANFVPKESGGGNLGELINGLQNGDLAKIGDNLHNDLAPALYRKFPILTLLRGRLIASGALGVEISGSGPTLFAIFGAHKAAVEAGKLLGGEFAPLNIFVN